MKRDTQAVLLLLVGGTLLKISLTGTYVRYVKPGLLPLLLIAGAVLVTVAGVTVWQVIQAQRLAAVTGRGHALGGHGAHGPRSGNAHEPRSDDADGHGHSEPRIGWLLLVPALALLLFAPPALGAFQASRNGTALASRAQSDFAPLGEGDPIRLSLLDYASRAMFDEGRSLAGRRVVLSGFTISGMDDRPYLARLVVGCCAADARPIKIGLAGDVPTGVAPDQWIEVVGAYTDRVDRDEVNQDLIPYLQVATSRNVPAPREPYES